MTEIEKLGLTFNKRAHQVQKATKGLTPEIGTITGSLGLHVNSVSNTIPKGAYLIARDLTLGKKGDKFETSSGGYTVPIPEKMASVKSGDRVLVIWCGNEPVVVSVLEES